MNPGPPLPVAPIRAELDRRQEFVARLLADCGAEQLLLLEPANIAWFAGAPLCRSIIDPGEQPAVVVSGAQRWVICSNVDSVRLFATFLGDLGFQLKEWPWYGSREQLLADLCEGRSIASDRPIRDARFVAEQLRQARWVLDGTAQAHVRALGRDLAHALAATARNAGVGEMEQEIAGQLAHRLVHRGIEPIAIHVAADGRDDSDARPGFGSARCHRAANLTAIGRRDGLHAAASRAVWFREPDAAVRAAFDATGQILAARQSRLGDGITVASVFDAGQKVAEAVGLEHNWRTEPFGFRTGRLPVEQLLSPAVASTFMTGQSVVLAQRVGPAAAADTLLVTSAGCERVTTDDDEPVRRYRLGHVTLDLPDAVRRYTVG